MMSIEYKEYDNLFPEPERECNRKKLVENLSSKIKQKFKEIQEVCSPQAWGLKQFAGTAG